MKNKVQIDREIASFKETLAELKNKHDVANSTAGTTIRKIITLIEEMQTELKTDTFISFVEQVLGIKLDWRERYFILGRTGYEEVTLQRSINRGTLLECIKVAYEGEDILDKVKGTKRLIRVPRGLTYCYKGAVLPAELLCEIMNKLYQNNWRYYIK